MVGRWWSPSSQQGQTLNYSGPFIQWNVEAAWDRRAAAVSPILFPDHLFRSATYASFSGFSMFLITKVLSLVLTSFVLICIDCLHLRTHFVTGHALRSRPAASYFGVEPFQYRFQTICWMSNEKQALTQVSKVSKAFGQSCQICLLQHHRNKQLNRFQQLHHL